MRIGRVEPNADIVFLDLWRSDTILTGGNVFDKSDFHFHLYIDPSKGGTASRARMLVEDLRRSMSSDLNITVRDEKWHRECHPCSAFPTNPLRALAQGVLPSMRSMAPP